MAEFTPREERESYKSRSQSEAILTREVTAENSIFESRLNDKNDEIAASTADKVSEEENKDFWGWISTIGTTVGCMALTGGTMTPACLALGTAGGATARVVTDLTSHAEGAPEGIDVSGAKYNKQAWQDVEGDVQAQLDALISFDENVWKKDVMAQAGDTWSAYKAGSTIESLGFFTPDEVVDTLPGESVFDTELGLTNSYNPPKIS